MGSSGFFIDLILLPQNGPGVDSACNRNGYQRYLLDGKGGRWVGLEILPPSCTDCLEILVWSTSRIPKGLSRPVQEYLYLYVPVCISSAIL